jgi:hypothetical protein
VEASTDDVAEHCSQIAPVSLLSVRWLRNQNAAANGYQEAVPGNQITVHHRHLHLR